MALIFSVENGCFGYPGGENILRGINLEVHSGEVLAVLGPNGVGKTTLLKCMMGLLKWNRGDSKLDGVPVPAIPYRELWQKIAYVPQAKNAVFSMTTLEMVILGRNAHLGIFHQPGHADIEIAEKVMEELGVSYLADKQCNRISGGELQLILLARALAAEPGILILDEPESNLDFKNQLIILETITRLSREKNIACIFNTHYPSHALSISDKALLLNKRGRSFLGPAGAVINEDNMREAFSVNVHISDLTINERCYKSVLALSIV
jgi:iron complex transport system ATP-binding protein